MSLVRLNIKGISYSQTQSGAYALILSEVDGKRKLPIVIGAFEAQSIAIALEKEIQPPRPLTHDLFKNFSDRYDITVKQVVIHKLVVTFDHVNKLVYITAWDHDIANFLFWLHLLLHHERIGELLGHYPAVQGYRWILGDGSTQHFCEFE